MAAGAEAIVFSEPAIIYVPDCLGMPPGGAVPSGNYDRTFGLWVCSENGRVIRFLGVTGGLADLDSDGDGQADDPNDPNGPLAALGITAEELELLATEVNGELLFEVDQVFWRVTVTHFSPWDFNWAFRLPPGAARPNATIRNDERSTVCSGDPEGLEKQVLQTAVPIAGTPFNLEYQSDCGGPRGQS